MNTPVPRWYAVYLRSRYEKRASERLRENNVETFLPLVEEVHVWSDRKKRVLEPLFRGYTFVRTDLRNKEIILQTDGVVRLVGIGPQPSPIPDEQIEWIRIMVTGSPTVMKEQYLSAGERVRVIGGPFEGLEGIVMRTKSSTRIVVSLDVIAQSVSVEVSPDLVRVVQASAAVGADE
ncbi:MAG: UpxY family transcription antiterminator [Bacteroidetes bacterium]|nr:UpxY family transcription antiterminator [Bacteroidota bacterium]